MVAVKQMIGGTFEDVGEAVVKPVVDEVGKAIEAGVQSVIQGPAAQQTQQKPQESTGSDSQKSRLAEQKNLAEARRKLDYWKKLEEEQRKVREEERRKEAQRQQSQAPAQDKQQKQIKQFQIVKKEQEIHPALAGKGKMEIKRGVGG